MISKQIVVNRKAYRSQIQDREDSRCSGIAFLKRMNLPQVTNKMRDVCNHFLIGGVCIRKCFFRLYIIIQSIAQILPIQIVNRIFAEYPFFLGNIVFTQFSGMFEYSFKNTAV